MNQLKSSMIINYKIFKFLVMEKDIKTAVTASIRNQGKAVVWVAVIAVALVLVVWGAVKFFSDDGLTAGGDQTAASSTEGQLSEKEIKSLLTAASSLILLPEEEPTIVTITNAKEAAAQQTFYQGSVDGDKLIVFPKAQKALIYSPSREILVNVGPVYFNEEQTAAAAEKKPAGTSTDETD